MWQAVTKERVKIVEDRIRIWVFRESFKVSAGSPVIPRDSTNLDHEC